MFLVGFFSILRGFFLILELTFQLTLPIPLKQIWLSFCMWKTSAWFYSKRVKNNHFACQCCLDKIMILQAIQVINDQKWSVMRLSVAYCMCLNLITPNQLQLCFCCINSESKSTVRKHEKLYSTPTQDSPIFGDPTMSD